MDGCRKHRQLPRLPGEYPLFSRRRRHAPYHYRGSQQPVRDARWLVCIAWGAYTRRRSEAHSGGGLLPGQEGSDLAGANTRGQKQVRPKQGGTNRQEGSVSGRYPTPRRGSARGDSARLRQGRSAAQAGTVARRGATGDHLARRGDAAGAQGRAAGGTAGQRGHARGAELMRGAEQRGGGDS